jgi:hypothetical protein
MPATSAQQPGTAVAIWLLALIALAFAIAGYLNSSTNAAWDEFLTTATVTDLDHPAESLPSVQSNGRTGCPVGKKQLPTHVTTLP